MREYIQVINEKCNGLNLEVELLCHNNM